MLRGVWGDDKRFRDTYFKSGDLKGGNGEGKGKGGVYVTGDRARRDHQGQYWITGRADDVMVVSGHNIGTAEVESAAVCHPLIGEAAVVGVPHELKGTSMCLFVSLVSHQTATTCPSFPAAGVPGSSDTAELCAEVKALVRYGLRNLSHHWYYLPMSSLLFLFSILIRVRLGSFAKPDNVHIVPPRGLPKTRSGKIMRRILRKVRKNCDLTITT
jgi:acetyl-CoA synthetase